MTAEDAGADPGGAQPGDDSELGAVKGQLLIFARELNDVFLRERKHRQALEETLDKLSQAYLATIKTLAFVVEAKDAYTRAHLERTHQYALALAQRVDPAIAADEVIGYGFLLHDVGKVAVPGDILGKSGPLSEDEWEVMRTHPEQGELIVSAMEFLGPAVAVIRHHHERWDGGGYPDGLAGDDIPLPARIFSIADTLDAMTTNRPYRAALPFETAVEEIDRCAGTQFDPLVVEQFLGLCDEVWRGDPPVVG